MTKEELQLTHTAGIWAWGLNLHYLSLAKIVGISNILEHYSLLSISLGCASPDKIPVSSNFASRIAPLLDLSSRNAPHFPPYFFFAAILEHHPRLRASGPGMGNITTVISRLPRDLFRPATATPIAIRPLSFS